MPAHHRPLFAAQRYNDMLSEAVRALENGQEPDLLSPTSGKRLASADRADQLDALLEEVIDRFGKLPAQGQALFDTHRLRILAKPYRVQKIDAGPKLMNITFKPNPPIDATHIIELVQKNRHIKLAGNDKLRIERPSRGIGRSSSWIR